MLYNKDWDKNQVKADPFSLENLIAWLEKQPADKVYEYFDNCGCMLHQYFSAIGLVDLKEVGGMEVWLTTGETVPLGEAFEDISVGYPRTFGAALDRARAALARV